MPKNDKPKTGKKEWFTHTIEKNLAISLARKGGYCTNAELPMLIKEDPVTVQAAMKLLLKNGNAEQLLDGYKLVDDLIMMLQTS